MWFANMTPAIRSRGKILPIETEGIDQSMDTAAGTVDSESALILPVTGTSFYWIWVLYSRVNNTLFL